MPKAIDTVCLWASYVPHELGGSQCFKLKPAQHAGSRRGLLPRLSENAGKKGRESKWETKMAPLPVPPSFFPSLQGWRWGRGEQSGLAVLHRLILGP